MVIIRVDPPRHLRCHPSTGGELLFTTTPSAYASLRRDTPTPGRGLLSATQTKGNHKERKCFLVY
ncbi:MAG: hypothetical protein LBB23_05040 [Rickettsiales bacterium]|nr:hypothetical protein [Rickettsiales bacterium]